MQKLVTIFLGSGQEQEYSGYREELCKSGQSDKINCTREHLVRYLEDGWVVKSVNTLAASEAVCGWVVVLLEKM